MTAFNRAWALVKTDPHSWTPGKLVIGNTGLPSSYECVLCGAEKHSINERNPSREGMVEAIERFGPYYDFQGYLEKYGIGETVEHGGWRYHYTNPTKPECDPTTLEESTLFQRNKRLEEYMNPPPIDFDTLPQIQRLEYGTATSGHAPFEAHTEHGIIRNDGRGGATYFVPTTPEGRQFTNVSEWHWDELLDHYENTQEFSNTLGSDFE